MNPDIRVIEREVLFLIVFFFFFFVVWIAEEERLGEVLC